MATTDIPEPDPSKKPIKPVEKSDKMPYFIFGCISLFVIFFALYFLKTLTADQRFFFKILFALGCAGVAATIPGISTLRYKGTISATGAIVVFLIIIFLKFPGKFTLTLFPKQNLTGEKICIAPAVFSLQLRSRPVPGENADGCEVTFSELPADYLDSEVDTLKLSIDKQTKWVFPNNRRYEFIKIKDTSMDIPMIVDSNYLKVGGIFYINKVGAKRKQVVDMEDNRNSTVTNDDGHFTMRFKPNDTRDEVTLRLVTGTGKDITNIKILMGNIHFEQNF